MRRILFTLILAAGFAAGYAQNAADSLNYPQNSADYMLNLPSKLTIGGYGEVEYIQKLDNSVENNAKLDVHRLVMLFGYKFSDRTSFVTEIEFEHVKEVYIEQAFLDHRLTNFMSLRAGLLLVPMGYINEYHEPTSFNGVLRPMVDKYIVPTTWREIGAGITGNILPANLRYQLYVMNGFKSYDGSGTIGGSSGFRKGRQKGAESFMSYPNLSSRVSFYGLPGLNLGWSAYFGKTQSTLYDGIQQVDNALMAMADSSVVSSFWTGIDVSYQKSGLGLMAQLYLVDIAGASNYNAFTGKDLGDKMGGFYVEADYDVLRLMNDSEQKLKPFIRYEQLNTHMQVPENTTLNESYNRTYVTTGLGWWLANGAVLKADLQFSKNAASEAYSKTLNLGVGVRF